MQLKDIHYLVALKSIDGIGNKTLAKLLHHFEQPHKVFQTSAKNLKSAGLKPSHISAIRQFDFDTIAPVFSWAENSNCHIIPFSSPLYPSLLSQIHNPPMVIFTMGNLDLLATPQIAVVGSRSPSNQGLNNTHSFCQALVEKGLSVTSGLASGIDGEAHRTALACGGNTIAVCGTGLNRVYPASHRELAHEIANRGLLVSEMLPDEGQSPGSFPQRNRIIAGLSLGTLVIEAAAKSGSLITANLAMEEGREVYAIPGSIHNPMSKGCHRLIKQGAKLTETIEDIVEDLSFTGLKNTCHQSMETREALNQDQVAFLQHVDYELTSIDTIVSRSQLTVEAVTNKLLALELQGWVVNSVGGYIRQ